MERLTKRMFGTKYYPTNNLFNLRCGQICGKKDMMIKNAGWYNKQGEKLGWGDLSTENFQHISGNLKNDALFIILREYDSYWKFVKFRKSGSMVIKREEEAPGIDYVAEKCAYIIARNQMYFIDNHDSFGDKYNAGGLTFSVLQRHEVKKFIAP